MTNVIPFRKEETICSEDILSEHKIATLTAALILLMQKNNLKEFSFSTEDFFSTLNQMDYLKTGLHQDKTIVSLLETSASLFECCK